MPNFADLIIPPARLTRSYAEMLLKGITPETFARKPRFEDKGRTVVIDTNHPAWAYGHLCLYPAKVMAIIGRDASKAAAPAGFDEVFKNGTACQDDPDGTIYPAMEAVISHFLRSYDALIEAVSTTTDAALSAPSDESVRQRFPLVGTRVNFMLNNHVMTHMGQVSAWRRCMGLPSAM